MVSIPPLPVYYLKYCYSSVKIALKSLHVLPGGESDTILIYSTVARLSDFQKSNQIPIVEIKPLPISSSRSHYTIATSVSCQL